MCSNIVLVVFMAGIIAGGGLCVVSMATPGWFGMYQNGEVQWKSLFSCLNPTQTDNYCKNIWDLAGDWVKAVMALSIIGILASVAALAWSIVVCFMCCCKSCLGPPLPILAAVAFCCQLAACIIYGVKVKPVQFEQALNDPKDTLGYSYILLMVGTVVYFVDIILGGLVVMFGAF